MSKRILLVEDDAFVRDLYYTVLTKAGYEVEVANDGEEAVGMVSYKVYDLILLDIMLPKLTGMEVLKAIRAEGSRAQNTPVYLLTNLGEENIIKESYKLGANGYLLKAKYLPKQLVDEVDKFFVKSPGTLKDKGEEGEKASPEIKLSDDAPAAPTAPAEPVTDTPSPPAKT